MTKPSSGAETSPQPRISEDDRIARLQLLRSPRVGPATYRRLMAAHGTATESLRALPDLARSKGVKSYQLCSAHLAQREYFTGKKIGADLIFDHEPGYPRLLSEISDAPPFLWVLGHQEQLMRPCVAVVGARNASSLGTRMAHRLAAGLAEAGVVVVSGLARGIDAAAHAASLPQGTIGVHAGGVDVIYPAENTELAKSILQKGARISEQPIGFNPTARFFPKRNRIIAGLCQAFVIVEAAAKSGTFITARQALEQGREVLAVPGHPMDARAAGCNVLIRDGACLVRSVDDILQAIYPATHQPPPQTPMADQIHPQAIQTTLPLPPSKTHAYQTRRKDLVQTLHNQILNRLSAAPLAEDQLIRDLKKPAAHVAPAITELELSGRLERHPGGLLTRIHNH
ncbi:MAG: DNA-processing protein DprA [Planktomarina sp.]|uniref:DNA-processing protein DprA n=1 Tax=Planktomarina sp. TaxID=2024851 RepID=UPI003C635691